MKGYGISRIGQNKGAPRIWLEGHKPARGGFTPGVHYTIAVDASKSLLTLEVVESGVRIVSGKKRGTKEVPVIDINSKELLSMFEGYDSVRVVFQDQKIFILPVASELRAKERLERLKQKLQAGEVLQTGSISTGVGVLDQAAHKGLAQAGIKSRLAFANEIRDDCMEHAVEHNSVFDKDTILLTAPMQELAFDEYAMAQLPKVDIFCSGLPCSGASIAGRTKNKIAHPEAHEHVGHLVVAFLAIIAKVSPAAIVFENVPPYKTSASADIIRNQLRDLGYIIHETELNSADWGMLEHRKRLCMVAVTRGISFSFDDLVLPEKMDLRVGDIMDAVDPEHSTWGSIDYLWKKRDRDAAEGKGFAPTVVDENSIKVPTLNKTLHKKQSTGTFFRHPTKANFYRIPTVTEHARIKGIDEALAKDTTQTFGHEIFGQSICVPPFVSVFELLGHSLQAFARSSMTSSVANPLMERIAA